MKLIKLAVIVAAIIGAVSYFGIKPEEMQEKGGEMWGKLSTDFMAIFSGKAKEEMAQEMRGNVPQVVQQNPLEALPQGASQEMREIVNTLASDRKEATETKKVIEVDAAEFKRRLEEQRQQLNQ